MKLSSANAYNLDKTKILTPGLINGLIDRLSNAYPRIRHNKQVITTFFIHKIQCPFCQQTDQRNDDVE